MSHLSGSSRWEDNLSLVLAGDQSRINSRAISRTVDKTNCIHGVYCTDCINQTCQKFLRELFSADRDNEEDWTCDFCDQGGHGVVAEIDHFLNPEGCPEGHFRRDDAREWAEMSFEQKLDNLLDNHDRIEKHHKQEVKELHSELAECQKDHSRLKKKYNKEIRDLHKELADYHESYSRLEKQHDEEIQALHVELSQCRENHGRFKKQHAQEIQGLHKQTWECRESQGQIESQMKILRERNGNLQKAHDEFIKKFEPASVASAPTSMPAGSLPVTVSTSMSDDTQVNGTNPPNRHVVHASALAIVLQEMRSDRMERRNEIAVVMEAIKSAANTNSSAEEPDAKRKRI